MFYDVSMTARIQVFFGYMIKIATFELWSPDNLYDYLFEYKDPEPYNIRFETMNVEKKGFVCVMGFMFIILIMNILTFAWLALVTLIRARCFKENEKFNKYVDDLKQKLIWTAAMTWVQEAYMDLVLALSLWARSKTDIRLNGDALDWVLIVIFGFVVVLYPIVSLFFLLKNREKFFKAFMRDKTI